MSDKDPLATLAIEFSLISLVAFGGLNAMLPEMHRQAVDVYGWMTDTEFRNLFALAQAAPGPNGMVVTLIGWHVAGVAGAIVATLAVTLPSCALAYVVSGTWQRFREARWRKAVQAGLVPVTVGLIASSALIITQTVGENWRLILITAVTTLIILKTKLHPLALLGAAAVIGYIGLL